MFSFLIAQGLSGALGNGDATTVIDPVQWVLQGGGFALAVYMVMWLTRTMSATMSDVRVAIAENTQGVNRSREIRERWFVMFEKPRNVDLLRLLRVWEYCMTLGIHYGFGEKIHNLTACPPHERYCDCSGAVRYGLYQATEGMMKVPDGSVNQHAWCDFWKLHKLAEYQDILEADDSRLFICFIHPTPDEAGHVWLVNAGVTIECHGGKGFARREWDTPVLINNCSAAYELPTVGGHCHV